MKIINYLFLFITITYSYKVFGQTIGVVNIQFLIDNNVQYNEKIKEIQIIQETYLEDFKLKENELKNKLIEIENSKLILNDNEINLLIEDYNNQLNNFTIIVEEFNIHFQNQIILMRENILKEIIVLLQKYATLNNIDLILDSTSYLIASNSLDITEIINKELKKIELKLEYKNFEKN